MEEKQDIVFWAWNGKMQTHDILNQILIFKKMGFAGFVIQARKGLEIEYMSDEWFLAVKESIRIAKKMGMNVWIYDEFGWPSGFAGGFVTQHKEFRAKYLSFQEEKTINNLQKKNLLAVFSIELNKEQLIRYEKINDINNADQSESKSYLAVYERIAEENDWYNGNTYLDILNPLAVKQFIIYTHMAYKNRLGDDFKYIKGFYTDEPCYYDPFIKPFTSDDNILPWTVDFPSIFKEYYGYNLLDYLPELFFVKEEFSKVCLDYKNCLNMLYVKCYAIEISRWCKKNGKLFTGHLLSEHTLQAQSESSGSCMRFYRYMDIPGMDLLSETSREYHTAKLVTSVANQFNKKRRLVEIYGGTGWGMTFEGFKALGDWTIALGLNFRCQHHALYTIKAERKRDHPISLSSHVNWWMEYIYVEKYFDRVLEIVSRGIEISRILLLYPIESIWALSALKNQSIKGNKIEKAFLYLTDIFIFNHLDFDYGDEEILSQFGKIKVDRDAKLYIKNAGYSIVVVPPLLTIRRETLNLLTDFVNKGGNVIWLAGKTKYIGGKRVIKNEASIFNQFAYHRKREWLKYLTTNYQIISVRDCERECEAFSILSHIRFDYKKREYYLFLVNTGEIWPGKIHTSPDKTYSENLVSQDVVSKRKKDYNNLEICLKRLGVKRVRRLDCNIGKMYNVQIHKENDTISFKSSLAHLESKLYILDFKEYEEKSEYEAATVLQHTIYISQKEYDVEVLEDNVLVLDAPRYLLMHNESDEQVDFSHLNRMINVPILKLSYSFILNNNLCSNVFLASEALNEETQIYINGNQINTTINNDKWWIDKSIKIICIHKGLLSLGLNNIDIYIKADGEFIEPIYILGKFAVSIMSGLNVIHNPIKKLSLGNWVEQGLPYYPGNVKYIVKLPKIALQNNQRIILHIPEYHGTAVVVYMNDIKTNILAWPPYNLDITDYWNDEREQYLGLVILGSRRNVFGPFVSKHIDVTRPETFVQIDMDLKYEIFQEYGLYESPYLTIEQVI